MNKTWDFFLFLTLLCILIQGFFAMLEMACVSFNKVRLQYYLSKNNRRAKWLSFLLNHPSQLFGTTLIGVNAALQLGSESSRRFYESLGISPHWAPLSQIFIVLIFAEITPMFTGRRFSEHVTMLGVPIIYLLSKIFKPIIWLFDALCHLTNRLVRSPGHGGLYLSREELQNVLEEHEEARPAVEEEKEFNTVAANIFSLKNKTAKELMLPLSSVQLIPSSYTIAEMRTLLTAHYTPYLPVYHRNLQNIVAIAYPRDLLRLTENKRVREHARPPWFITENNSILQILKQFRRNNQVIAVVLNEAGLAIGILTLDRIVDEILGQYDHAEDFGDNIEETHQILVDRSFPGDTKIEDFNKQYHAHLEAEGTETLEELMTKHLGHLPVKGETVHIDPFELTVEEVTILGVKTISVKTI